jgi:hypothetical protein
MQFARKLPPTVGRKRPGYRTEDAVMCSLRIPPEYLEALRQIAQKYETSNGGALMVLVDAHAHQVTEEK